MATASFGKFESKMRGYIYYLICKSLKYGCMTTLTVLGPMPGASVPRGVDWVCCGRPATGQANVSSRERAGPSSLPPLV